MRQARDCSPLLSLVAPLRKAGESCVLGFISYAPYAYAKSERATRRSMLAKPGGEGVVRECDWLQKPWGWRSKAPQLPPPPISSLYWRPSFRDLKIHALGCVRYHFMAVARHPSYSPTLNLALALALAPAPAEFKGALPPAPAEFKGPLPPAPAEFKGPLAPAPAEFKGPLAPAPAEFKGPLPPAPAEFKGAYANKSKGEGPTPYIKKPLKKRAPPSNSYATWGLAPL
jgi:hypothetical protein